MARVVAYIPDLLFGSNVLSALERADLQVALAADLSTAAAQLAGAELLIVDLTADALERIEAIQRLRPADVPVLAFYSHVEAAVRERAETAGFELVIPRSRMAREGAVLAERLLAR